MSRSGSPKWGQVPTLVLDQVYEYLSQKDRLEVSRVCRHWRSALFQRKFFSDFKFLLHIDNERQCNFFRHKLCHLITEITIIFDFLNLFHIEKIRRILFRISRCDNLRGLHFQTNNVGLMRAGEFDEGLVDIERCFVEPLKLFLNRRKSSCKILDLGGIEALAYYGVDFLKAVGNPKELQQLTLASLKFDPSHYPILTLDGSFLQKLSNLQVLSLDYDTLNESVLEIIQSLPLKKFVICVHGLDRRHPGISETAWANFSVASSEKMELVLSLIYAFEAVDVLHVRILRRNMPITHLRVLFCDAINADALEWMSLNNNNTIKSIQWIDSAYKNSDKNVMDLFLRSGQDPFVMMAWRCKNLEEIVIHGYVLDPHNIVGISRLRGRTLKRFEVSMIDNTPSEASMDSFKEEINSLLGQKWEPLNTSTMHPAIGYIPCSDDLRDEYVFDLLRSDISM